MIWSRDQYKISGKFARTAFLFLSLCLTVFSQSGTTTVTGTVTDAQGNALPGAAVTLISQQNARRTTATSESGAYSFSSLQPGEYRIEVEAAGFKKAGVTSFQALVDNAGEINVQMEVGQVTEIVTIDAAGIDSIVNTQNASLGSNFVSRQIEQLPLQGRNVADLLSLQAAATPDGSVSGSRSDQANITLDGIDVNEQQQGAAFSPVLRVTPDSIEEFRVTTSNPDASQGRSSGAQISLITKSGTNEFRGALYEYHRNTITSANSFFNNMAGIERPKLIRNLFGGRLGGPVVKDRFFFFYNYEGMRETKDTGILRIVPTASLAQGSIRFEDVVYDDDGNIVGGGDIITLTAAQINSLTLNGAPVVDVNPLVPQLFSGAASNYPCNDLSQGDGLNTCGFRFNAPVSANLNTHTARFDWVVTGDQRHLISARGNYQQDVSGGVTYLPGMENTDTWSHPLGFALTHTWLIDSNMTNRLSYGLTRLAFSNQGDSNENAVYFRNTFLQPEADSGFVRTLSRVSPTHNFTNDFTWIKGNHSIQMGVNVRLIRNKRTNFARTFDDALTNYSAYEAGGAVIINAVNQYLVNASGENRAIAPGWELDAATALAALFGRLSQYSVNFNFDLNGNPLPDGSPVVRDFRTEEYDFYVQDTWKVRPNLTLTGGLRYGLSHPVYEAQGYMAVPNIPLAEYLQRRINASRNGENYTEPLTVIKAGPGTEFPNIYDWDKNNFQPRLAIAWSPRFESGFPAKIFGRQDESVIRAGFGITNDYFGQQLAVQFDGANSLGFSSSYNTPVNLYNITDNPAPLYTGPGQSVRTLPNVLVPGTLTFPQQQPFLGAFNGQIETSLDTNLQSPVHYSWNVSYGRSLWRDMYVDVSYIGRVAQNLLTGRDVMALNNITDPISGQTFYEAAQILERQRQAGVPTANIAPIPFFENMYAPGSVDTNIFGSPNPRTNTQAVYALVPLIGDWTYTQAYLDESVKPLFFQGQYSALSAFGTIGSSNYNALAISVRQRLKGLTWDFNYTYSKSMDDASGLQTASLFGTGFILNALDKDASYAVSDFDLTHIVNFNSVWDIPVGRGRRFGGDMGGFLNALLGGWQLSSIFRYDSGYPLRGYEDGSGWQTNWQVRSRMVLVNNLQTSPCRSCGNDGVPNLYSDPDAAYASFRTPYPGESGNRNQLRYPHYIALDAGLTKSFEMPWSEDHRLTFRWDVFNVTNTVVFTGQSSGIIGYTGGSSNQRPNNWGNFTGERSTPRVMQFALRYDF